MWFARMQRASYYQNKYKKLQEYTIRLSKLMAIVNLSQMKNWQAETITSIFLSMHIRVNLSILKLHLILQYHHGMNAVSLFR